LYIFSLSEAYEVIGDEDKRKQYDAYGSAGSGNQLLRQLKDSEMIVGTGMVFKLAQKANLGSIVHYINTLHLLQCFDLDINLTLKN
jgi:DnaJ-class molecular chaperone